MCGSAHEMCREPAYDRHTRCVEHSRWMAQAWMGHGWDNPSAEVGGSGSRESERRTRCVAVRHDRGVVLEVMSCTERVQKNKGEGMDACASSSRLPHQDRPSPRPRGGSSFPGASGLRHEGAGSERADARGISRASPSGGWASQQRRDIRSA